MRLVPINYQDHWATTRNLVDEERGDRQGSIGTGLLGASLRLALQVDLAGLGYCQEILWHVVGGKEGTWT